MPAVTACVRPDVSVLCPPKPSATAVEARDEELTLSPFTRKGKPARPVLIPLPPGT